MSWMTVTSSGEAKVDAVSTDDAVVVVAAGLGLCSCSKYGSRANKTCSMSVKTCSAVRRSNSLHGQNQQENTSIKKSRCKPEAELKADAKAALHRLTDGFIRHDDANV